MAACSLVKKEFRFISSQVAVSRIRLPGIGRICRVLHRAVRQKTGLYGIFVAVPLLSSSLLADDETDSLLFYLSIHGPAVELSRLIEKGVSVNERTPGGVFPLLAAVQANNPVTVAVLLDHGADPLATDTMNLDPLYWALHKGFYPVADVLLEHGVNIDRPNSQGNTPLISAVMRGDYAMATYLLGRGADRSRKSKAGQTPLKIASKNHDKSMIALLSSHSPTLPIEHNQPSVDQEANDSGATFTDANSFFAEIQAGRRSFRKCSLAGLDLKAMRLYGLNFSEANLSGCDLRGADLRYCDLTGAALRNAYLHQADLRNAKVDSSDFGDAILTSADLRDVSGLSFVQLRSVRSLYKSKLDGETVEVLQRDYPNLFKDPGSAWKTQGKSTASR